MGEEARVAVVDDDKMITRLVSSYLAKSGFDVSVANTHDEFQKLVQNNTFDVVLLDLHMPDGHGLDLARTLRSDSDQVGIIIVSGTEDDIDKIVGLEMGADDFVAKPFEKRELLARVRTVLRRVNMHGEVTSEGRVKFGEYELDLDTQELMNDQGDTIHLTSHEFSLLKLLVSRTNRVLNRDQIMQNVSGRDWMYSDRTVDVLVGKLRKKIESDPAHPRFIKTIRGMGYKFTNKAATAASM